ncbi:MAG: hypothetical protein HZB42_01250 [Sphingobacteriales bacterium]|nr:hypothetical protein [Sphingobacteriales bacterium]
MTESSDNLPTPQPVRSFKILVAALMIGLSCFALIILLIIQVSGPAMPPGPDNINDIFLLAAAGIAVLCLLSAFTGYTKRLKKIRNSVISLDDKLNQYREALILYMALCEVPGILSVIIFFLTGDYKALIITGIMLAAMFAKFPQKQKIINELTLGWKEQQELE